MNKDPLPDDVFRRFSQLIQQHSGIQLADNRKQMLQNRVNARMKQLNLNDMQAYFDEVVRDVSGEELNTLIDSVTTNYTSFFRDPRQFELLGEELKRLLAASRKKIRLWSAACSTGEELFSIAITASEIAKATCEPMLRFRLLGTDIAQSCLESTHQGIYKAATIASLKPVQRAYFDAFDASEPKQSLIPGTSYVQIKTDLRRQLILRKFNLCDASWSVPEGIDVIFLRNVLLYFDAPTQKKILQNALSKLASDGLLFVGASESVRHLIPDAQYVAPSVFRRKQETKSVVDLPIALSEAQTCSNS